MEMGSNSEDGVRAVPRPEKLDWTALCSMSEHLKASHHRYYQLGGRGFLIPIFSPLARWLHLKTVSSPALFPILQQAKYIIGPQELLYGLPL